MEEEKKSKISNVEWGLVIGILFVIDLIQIVLDLFAVGVAVNRLLDIFVGLCFGFYLQIRGESLVNPKRLLGLIATFLGEMVPVIDALPLWGLDGIFNMSISKSKVLRTVNKVVEIGQSSEIKPGNTASNIYSKEAIREKTRGRSFIEKVNIGTEQMDALNKKIRERRGASE